MTLEQKKLNLRCGSQVPDTGINVDSAVGARLAKIPFFGPLKSESADIVYTSHTLEHFTREEGCQFLSFNKKGTPVHVEERLSK